MTHAQSDPFPSLGATSDFLRTLWELSHAIERASRRMETTWGVTTQQRMIIRCVGKYPGIMPGHLAEYFCLDPGTVSATLDRLERKGLVERRRDGRDRRRVMLGLTPQGRAVDGEAVGAVEQALETVIRRKGLSAIETARDILGDLAGALERDSASADPQLLPP